MSDLDYGVATEDVDELELGATVYSRSIHYRTAYDGGVIIDIVRDEDDRLVHVVTMPGWHDPSSPRQLLIERSDINIESAQWWGKGARDAADAIMAWISNQRRRPRDAASRAHWAGIAAQLAKVGVGLYLPGAETRYRRHQQRISEERAS